MRIGRTLPPAAALIGWKNLFSAVMSAFNGESELDRFSDELKEYFGKKHCFLVSSGKTALSLILSTLKEQHPDRDEVVIPAYSCYSVPSAIVRAGLKIKICDTASDSFDFDFRQLSTFLDSQRTLCVVPIHLFGLSADVHRLEGIIRDPEVSIVEDAAQAMMGEWKGHKLGTKGTVSFFSLGRGKAFSTVEGGVILTDCDELASCFQQKVQALPNYTYFEIFKLFMYAAALNLFQHPALFMLPKNLPSLKLGETIYDPYFKMKKMSSFQAGLAKDWVSRGGIMRRLRKENIKKWISFFKSRELTSFVAASDDIPDLIRFPFEIKCKDYRKEFKSMAERCGLGISKMYPDTINNIPEIHSMFKNQEFPHAHSHAETLLTLPIHHYLEAKDWEKVFRTLSETTLLTAPSSH